MAIKKTSFGMEDQGQIDRQRMLAQALMSQQHQSGPPQGWNSMPVVPAYGAGNALADSLSSILPQLGGMALDKQADTKQSALNTKTSSGNDALVEALTRQANPMMMKRDESNMPIAGTAPTPVNDVETGRPPMNANGQMMSQMLQGQDPQQVRQMLSQAMVSKLIPPTPAPYTLGPGQARYENGKQVAAVPVKPGAPEKPMDELSKLNADFKAGRIAKADYDARKLLMTTRAPNVNSAVDEKDPKIESMAQRIARYDAPPINGISATRPQGMAVMDRVEQIHNEKGTTYHGEEYPTRQASYKAFATGKQGDAVKAFNVGISHLSTAQELADALGNGDIKFINRISQKFAEETGSSAPTNLDTAKEVIKAEIVKSIVGGPGAEKDREHALAAVDRASSPTQLKDGIKIAQRLMGGQLGGLKRQYEQSTGRDDFDRLLSKDAQPFLKTKEATGDSSADSGPVKISSDEEYAKLKSGDEFIGPDGKHRKKP